VNDGSPVGEFDHARLIGSGQIERLTEAALHGQYASRIVEGGYTAFKYLLGMKQSFRFLHSAKATLMAIKIIRTIKNGNIASRQSGVRRENVFPRDAFGLAA